MGEFKQGIKIFDTTLRDGEQMPGVVFSSEEKTELALKSSDFGCHVVNIMPSVSEEEFKLTKRLSTMGLRAEICADCMMNKKQVENAIRTGAQRIMPIVSVSDIHLEKKLGITRQENINRTLEIIDLVKENDIKLDLCFEDATRADMGYLLDFIDITSKKVDCFVPADTLGRLTPLSAYEFLSTIRKRTGTMMCFHGHNDFGMATSNAIIALSTGFEGISGTFNGIGERAGNIAIEEVCLASKYLCGKETGLKLEMLVEICRLVEEYSRVTINANKPVTGKNSFTHESGIHVDGIIKSPDTYENFNPREINRRRRFMFGKHSGMSGIRHALRKSNPPESQLREALAQLKSLSEIEKSSFSSGQVQALFKSNFGVMCNAL